MRPTSGGNKYFSERIGHLSGRLCLYNVIAVIHNKNAWFSLKDIRLPNGNTMLHLKLKPLGM